MWKRLQDMDPDYLEAYLTCRSISQQEPLEQKYKELIMIAIKAATTHLYGPDVRRHKPKTIYNRAFGTRRSKVTLVIEVL